MVALVLGDHLLHELDGVYDLDLLGQGVETGVGVEDVGIVVFAHLGYLDFGIVGRDGVLFIAEDFLVELLARTETGVLYLDVFAYLVTCQLDHAGGEVDDFDGVAHVEDEDFIAIAQGGGFHDETTCLGDGHEETDDIGVGDGDWSAFLYLMLEAGDDGAVAAEDIAEPRGDESGAALDLACLDGAAETLTVDFGEPLAAAHDAGGVDGLVGGDHDHLLYAELDAGIGYLTGADDIDEH